MKYMQAYMQYIFLAFRFTMLKYQYRMFFLITDHFVFNISNIVLKELYQILYETFIIETLTYIFCSKRFPSKTPIHSHKNCDYIKIIQRSQRTYMQLSIFFLLMFIKVQIYKISQLGVIQGFFLLIKHVCTLTRREVYFLYSLCSIFFFIYRCHFFIYRCHLRCEYQFGIGELDHFENNRWRRLYSIQYRWKQSFCCNPKMYDDLFSNICTKIHVHYENNTSYIFPKG